MGLERDPAYVLMKGGRREKGFFFTIQRVVYQEPSKLSYKLYHPLFHQAHPMAYLAGSMTIAARQHQLHADYLFI